MSKQKPTREVKKLAHWDKFTSPYTGETVFQIWNEGGFAIGTAINAIQAQRIVKALNHHTQLLKIAEGLAKISPAEHDHDLSFKQPDGSYSNCLWCEVTALIVSVGKS